MKINPGTRLGPYEIVAPIGAGGMGEVWRGRDTRLERSVAIKILSAEFAQNAELKVRFEREAKTISQLSHPNICTLFDVGDNYLVMELLEGETIADRLTRGALTVSEVFKYGVQIADALDKAHRAGIIHRDLKPSNIMLTKSGAKLLDFGLAKSAAPVVEIDGATQQKALTKEGTILGTFQYMAPEQLEGQEADARTDIFALGAVLYEMATGKRAFEGKTKTSLIAAIVKENPRPMTELQPLTPPALEHIVTKCLEKDPEDRWQNAHDIAEELRWVSAVGSQAGVATKMGVRRKSREQLAWTMAAALAVIAVVFGIGYVRRASQSQPLIRLTLATPPSVSIFPSDLLGIALSPDGSKLAFSATGKDGKRALWIRSLDQAAASAIPETEDASYPFWSPDGRYVAFFAQGKLKKVDLGGGSPRIISDAPSGRGGTWGRDDTIIFAPSLRSGISRVSANGGPVRGVVPDSKDTTFRWPHLLPDGKHFLYVSRAATSAAPVGQLHVASVDNGSSRLVLPEASNASYVEPGYLVYGRGDNLVAQPFDLKSLSTTGEPFAIIPERIDYFDPKNLAIFSVAENAALVYLPSMTERVQLAWYGREGQQLDSIGAPGFIPSATLSPDEKRVALVRVEPLRKASDIWIHDLTQNREVRLTYISGGIDSLRWSPDGSQILFTYQFKKMPDLYTKKLSGGDIEPVVQSAFWKTSPTWAPSSDAVIYGEQNPLTNYDLWRWSARDHTRVVLLKTPFDEYWPAVSPDGRWLAYRSNESGKFEIYVRSLTDAATQVQVSSGGGFTARWRAGGAELLFTGLDRTVMSVPVRKGSSFDMGAPKRLFQVPEGGTVLDVSRDGRKFLVTVPTERHSAPSFEVILNWQGLLKRP